MKLSEELPIPSWQAYGDLFRLIETKRKWSRDQLIDELRADGITKRKTQTSYSRRSLEKWTAIPKKGRPPTQPRHWRVEHLHTFLKEQVGILGEAKNFERHLKSIEPQIIPDASAANSKPPQMLLTPVHIALAKDISERIIDSLQRFNPQMPPVNNQSADGGRSCPRIPNHILHAWIQGEEQLEKLFDEGMLEVQSGRDEQGIVHFQQVAAGNLARAEECRIQVEQLQQHACRIFLLAALLSTKRKRLEGAVLPIRAAIAKSIQTRNADAVADLHFLLGVLYSMETNNQNNAIAHKYAAMAVKAYRASLKFFSLKERPSRWFSVQNNLGTSLMCQARLSSGKIPLQLFQEAAEAYRAALKVDDENLIVARIGLGSALLNQWAQLFKQKNMEKLKSVLREAAVEFRRASKILSYKKRPELWADLHDAIGFMFILEGLGDFSGKSIDESLKSFYRARNTLRKTLECRKYDKTDKYRRQTQDTLSFVENTITEVRRRFKN